MGIWTLGCLKNLMGHNPTTHRKTVTGSEWIQIVTVTSIALDYNVGD